MVYEDDEDDTSYFKERGYDEEVEEDEEQQNAEHELRRSIREKRPNSRYTNDNFVNACITCSGKGTL